MVMVERKGGICVGEGMEKGGGDVVPLGQLSNCKLRSAISALQLNGIPATENKLSALLMLFANSLKNVMKEVYYENRQGTIIKFQQDMHY